MGCSLSDTTQHNKPKPYKRKPLMLYYQTAQFRTAFSNCFKMFALLLLLFGYSSTAFAGRKILWVNQEGGKKHDKIRAIAVDAKGNSYAVGEFSDDAKVADKTIVSKGKLDFLLCKYSPDGKLIWVQTAGGSEIDRGYSVAVDKAENVYVTGHFQSPKFHIGGKTLINRGDYDYFVAKFSANGKLMWAQSAGSKEYDYGHGIAVTAAGDVYASGAFGKGDVALGESTSKGIKGRKMFIVKYNSQGKMLWSHICGNQYGHSAHEIAVDAKGACYVTGSVTGIISVDGHEIGTKTKLRDIFVFKLTPQGEFVWGQTTGGNSKGLGTSIVVDQNENVFIAGSYAKEFVWGSTRFKTKGENDIFIAKVNANGTPAWAHTGGGSKTDYGLGLAIDRTGSVYLTGGLTGKTTFAGKPLKGFGDRDLYIAKFSPKGQLNWIDVMGGDRKDLSYAIAVDHENNCFLSGAFYPHTQLQDRTLKSRGSNDIYLMKLSQ